MNKIKTSLLVILAVSFFSCCGSEKAGEKNEVSAGFGKVYAWLNLMPGSKARFHIKGDLNVKSKTAIPDDSVKISEMLIFQNDRLISSFIPLTTYRNDPDSGYKNIHFSEPEGEIQRLVVNADVPLNIQVFILHSGSKHVLELNNLKVEKVY